MVQSIHPSNDGSDTVFSEKYGAHYHSLFGAIEEAIHVFLSAGLYYAKRNGISNIKIFEMGFGTGLNAYLTYLEAHRFDLMINYHTIESDPVESTIYNNLNYPKILPHTDVKTFQSLHNLPWNIPHVISPHFQFTKFQTAIENHDFANDYDIIYYDAFAPSCQAFLWEEAIHQNIYDSLKKGGILVTYCTKGAFKRMLKGLGYRVETLNGPAKKREMLRAIKL